MSAASAKAFLRATLELVEEDDRPDDDLRGREHFSDTCEMESDPVFNKGFSSSDE